MERFLNSKLFIILGGSFFLIGIYSLFANSNGSGGVDQLILSFLTPTDGPVIEVAGGGLSEIVLYFLPALVVLIGVLLFNQKYRLITSP